MRGFKMQWIKLDTDHWLRGSGRNMTAEKRGIWADLLALAGEAYFRDGRLSFGEGKPMSRAWIARTLNIEPDTLDACIIAFQSDINVNDGLPRIQILDDGTLFLTNFLKYQAKPEKAKPKALTEEAREAMTRRNVNQRPDVARDTLIKGFGDEITTHKEAVNGSPL